MSKNKNQKKKGLPITVGTVFFAMVLIFMGIHLIRFLTSDPVSLYEIGDVTALTRDRTRTGIILRDETVTDVEGQGYISYFAAAGDRVSSTDVVYAIDESGAFHELINDDSGKTGLTDPQLQKLNSTITDFIADYNSMRYSEVYSFFHTLDSRLMGFLNAADPSVLKELGIEPDYFHVHTAGHTGIVEFYVDGYETLTPAAVTDSCFDEKNYTRTELKSGQLTGEGTPAYKTVDSEEWSIVIPLTDEDVERYADQDRIRVSFPGEGLENVMLFRIITSAEGNKLGVLTMSRYMIEFADQRYVRLILEEGETQGLKVPNTALVRNTCYEVPAAYLTTGGNSSEHGFLTEDAEGNIVFRTAEVIGANEENIYLNMDSIEGGTRILMPESTEEYVIGTTRELDGVYNMNKGYAVFRSVEILDSNEKYSILRPKAAYSVSAYDHILLNGADGYSGLMIY